MENLLKYYYNLKEFEIIKMENNFLILDNNDYSYLLYKVNDNININNILSIISKLRFKSNYGDLMLNVNNNYLSKINDNNYVLILLKGIINDTISLQEIVKNNLINRYLKSKDIDLVELWSRKIDYLEYQVSQLSKEKLEVVNSFSFFVGLAENAISFININNINFSNLHQTLCHTRLKSNNMTIDYYNPLNILVDYDIRDYAEYLKAKILETDDIIKDINYILDNAKLSDDDIKLLYARLMFPTIYFDVVEEVLLNETKEKDLEEYIEAIPRYLNMLKDIYIEINKKGISLDIPNWIIKN